ncbi:hypothetical protein L7F22_063466 [Adiantum nelumboides]|nr:hypothetical protein [Adiantum nelumboides]
MSAVLALPQVKDLRKTFAKGKEKGQEQGKEHDVNAHAVLEEGELSKKPWNEDIPELSSPSYSPPTSFSSSFDSSSSSSPRKRKLLLERFEDVKHDVVPGAEILDSTTQKKVGDITTVLGSRGLGLIRLEAVLRNAAPLVVKDRSGVHVQAYKAEVVAS